MADIDPDEHVLKDDGTFDVLDAPIELSAYRLEDWIALAICWCLAAVIFLQFFTRYALNDSAGRTEEIVRYLLIARIKWWEDYTARNCGEMNNNPSPGNKAGGLTTILEESLGAVAKGGTTNLVELFEYGQRVDKKGFVYMDTPGFDPVSATGQVAGGANMIVFTTGRGSAYGCAPAPSLKLSTNSEFWRKQQEDIDLNCGAIADGEASVEEIGAQLFEMILRTASGEKTKSELFGYGQQEFVPWQVGAVM